MKEPKTLGAKTHKLLRNAVAGTLGATLMMTPLIPAAMATDMEDAATEVEVSQPLDSSTQNAGTVTQTPVEVPSTPETPATPDPTVPAEKPIEYKGKALVEKFKKTGALTLQEIAQIDLNTLKSIDVVTYTKIITLKKALEDAQAKPETPDPTTPVEPDKPAGSETDPTEGEDTGSEEGGTDASEEEGEEADEEEPATLEEAKAKEEADATLKAEAVNVQAELVLPQLEGDVLPEGEDPFAASINYPQWTYSGDVTYIMHHYTDDLTTEKFIAVIGEQARSIANDTGVSASAMIAYAVIASQSGQADLAQAPTRNLFGLREAAVLDVKQDIYDESGILEDVEDGKELVSGANTETYDTYKDCFADYAKRMLVWQGADEEDASTFDIAALSDEQKEEAFDRDIQILVEAFGLSDDDAQAIRDVAETYELARFDAEADLDLENAKTVTFTDASGNVVTEQLGLSDLIAETTSHLGVPYLWGGTTTAGFDCSGLVQYSYSHSLGVGIPRTSYYQCTVGTDVDFADLHAGDLVFFQKKGIVGHVGMYLGDGYYIEAPEPGSEVKVTSIEEKRPSFAKRVLDLS